MLFDLPPRYKIKNIYLLAASLVPMLKIELLRWEWEKNSYLGGNQGRTVEAKIEF